MLKLTPKLILTIVVTFVVMWVIYKSMSRQLSVPPVAVQQPQPTDYDYIPGSGFQDPGYGSVVGSIGAEEEGFCGMSKGAGCPEHDLIKKYPNMPPFVQMACRGEPNWNLPYDARMQHHPLNPPMEGVKKCSRHHPMDTIYAPPNEGVY